MKKTVTVGIPAHNEEKNILSLLDGILKQNDDNFTLKKIIVVCDGCTDNTAEIVKEFAKDNPLITLIDDGKRRGKTTRLNELYKQLDTDLFVTFDADVTLGNNHVIEELVKQFTDEKVGLVGGRVYPIKQTTFIGKILEAQEYFWTVVINSIHNGNNLQSHTGPMSAGSKQFLRTVERPANIVADDHFLYFAAIKNGFVYKAAKNARVYIKVPSTFTDYMKQSTRFIDSADQIKSYFGSWTDAYYTIPYSKKLRAYLLAFLRFPLTMPLAIGLVCLRSILDPIYKDKHKNGTWTAIASTK